MLAECSVEAAALSAQERFDATQHMTAADVSLFVSDHQRHARVLMRKRKDLRVLQGKHAVVYLAGGGTLFDAAAELSASAGGAQAVGYPFGCPSVLPPRWDRDHAVAEVRDTVKAVMAAAGRDPSRYGAHSLRIGGATAAFADGVSPQLIRLMGRWSSDVYEIYCRMSMQSALHVGTAIASAIPPLW